MRRTEKEVLASIATHGASGHKHGCDPWHWWLQTRLRPMALVATNTAATHGTGGYKHGCNLWHCWPATMSSMIDGLGNIDGSWLWRRSTFGSLSLCLYVCFCCGGDIHFVKPHCWGCWLNGSLLRPNPLWLTRWPIPNRGGRCTRTAMCGVRKFWPRSSRSTPTSLQVSTLSGRAGVVPCTAHQVNRRSAMPTECSMHWHLFMPCHNYIHVWVLCV